MRLRQTLILDAHSTLRLSGTEIRSYVITGTAAVAVTLPDTSGRPGLKTYV